MVASNSEIIQNYTYLFAKKTQQQSNYPSSIFPVSENTLDLVPKWKEKRSHKPGNCSSTDTILHSNQ